MSRIQIKLNAREKNANQTNTLPKNKIYSNNMNKENLNKLLKEELIKMLLEKNNIKTKLPTKSNTATPFNKFIKKSKERPNKV